MRIRTFQPLISSSTGSLIRSETTTGRNSTFFEALASNKELGAARGIDAALKTNNLDALVLPAPGRVTTPPAGMAMSVRVFRTYNNV
jgi:amidase